jgi:hypothetical protein
MSYDLFGGGLIEPPPVYTPPPVISPPSIPSTPAPSEPQPLGFYINTVEDLPSTETPYVEIDESSSVGNIKFNFGLKQGIQGIQGQKGEDGGFGIEEELRMVALETAVGGIQTEIEGIGTAITNITADVAGLNTAVGVISGEVDTLQAEFTDLEPRVVVLEEKCANITNDGVSTNISNELIVIDSVICNRLFTTVFDNQPNLGVVWQFG